MAATPPPDYAKLRSRHKGTGSSIWFVDPITVKRPTPHIYTHIYICSQPGIVGRRPSARGRVTNVATLTVLKYIGPRARRDSEGAPVVDGRPVSHPRDWARGRLGARAGRRAL